MQDWMIFGVTVRSNFRMGSHFLSSGADYSLLDKSSSIHSAEKPYDVVSFEQIVRLVRFVQNVRHCTIFENNFLNEQNQDMDENLFNSHF